MGSILVLEDIPDDILTEILTFTWTLAPKRMCRRISNLYDKHLPNKLFHCLVSDLHTKPCGDVPMEILQFVYKTDRQTFDEIVSTDLLTTEKTYCFDSESFEINLRHESVKNIMTRNKDFKFEYTNKSILSNMILHKSDTLLNYALDLLVAQIESDIPSDYQTRRNTNRKLDKILAIIMLNALALRNEKVVIQILKIAEDRSKVSHYSYISYGDSSQIAILSMLLVKINKISLLERFKGVLDTEAIMSISILIHNDTIFDYVFGEFFRQYEIEYVIKLIDQSVVHDNMHVFVSLVRLPKICHNLFTKVVVSTPFGLQTTKSVVEHINCIIESNPPFLEAFGKIIRSQKNLWKNNKSSVSSIPQESLLLIEKPSDIKFLAQVLGQTEKKFSVNPSNKSHPRSKERSRNPVPKSFHKNTHR